MNNVFCNNCMFSGNEKDLKYHKCLPYWYRIDLSDKKKLRELECVRECVYTTLYFIFTFKPIFGKDVTNIISKMIYESRYEYSLWDIRHLREWEKHPRFNKKEKNQYNKWLIKETLKE